VLRDAEAAVPTVYCNKSRSLCFGEDRRHPNGKL